MTKKCISYVFKKTLPVFFGYITCGIAFGLVITNAGYPWWMSVFMAVFIFAGAAQFAAVPFFVAGAPLPVILLAEALLNVRHIVYGLPLIKRYKGMGLRKLYLMYALSDETFSVLTTLPPPEDIPEKDYFLAVSLMDQSYWVLGCFIGAVAGTMIPFDLSGVDFALTALFAVLTVDQFMKFFKKGGKEDSVPNGTGSDDREAAGNSVSPEGGAR